MRIPIVKVGNSRGIRIPKVLIEECNLGPEVSLEVKGQSLVITPARASRSGWAERFRKMADTGDDALLDGDLTGEWDKQEWEWK